LVLIEAMAFGLPIVSTACETGPRELLEDGRDAVMVAVDDQAALADALLRLITDRSEADRFGHAASMKATVFSEDRIAKVWNRLLR